MQRIEEKFARIFKYMGIPMEQIRMEASFVKDFNFEDFQFTCLQYYISSYFKINVTYLDLGELTTIGNTIIFVQRKLQVHFRLNEHDFGEV